MDASKRNWFLLNTIVVKELIKGKKSSYTKIKILYFRCFYVNEFHKHKFRIS